MTQALLAIGALFILVYGPLAILAWRRPLLARFAFRESIRRRGQFILIVVGLLAGSAAITASMVAADTGTQSEASALQKRLGAVDLTVTAPGGLSFSPDIARQLAADSKLSRYVDGVQAGVEAVASVGDLDRQLGLPGVLVVGFDPAVQHRFGTYVLEDGRRTDGGDMGQGDVLISRALATALDAQAGDHLHVSSASNAAGADLRVYGVAASVGPGAYGDRIALFTPLAVAQTVTGDSGINVVRIAARGGSAGDVEPARRAAAPINAALRLIPEGRSLLVNEVRVDTTRHLEFAAGWMLGTTLGFSGLVVLAAIALIVNLVLALAEERRPRLAVLRALGLTRSGLIAMSMLEGAIYSLAAATAGVAVGLVAGLYLGSQFWNAWLADPGDQTWVGSPLEFTVRGGTLALAFATGALITLGTFSMAAYRTSRLAISSAVRDLPEPASPVRDSWWRTGLLVGFGALGVAALVPDDLRLRLVGGIAVIIALTALARGRLSDRVRATLGGLSLTGWAALVASAERTSDLAILMTVFFITVAVAAIGLSLATAANLRLIETGLSLLGNRNGALQSTLRVPLAYLSRRAIRTGLATSAFATALVLVTLLAIVGRPQEHHYARDSAGFDIRVVANGPDPIQLPAALDGDVSSSVTLPMRLYTGPFEAGAFAGSGASVNLMFATLPAQPDAADPVYMSNREKRFPTEAAAWLAVRNEVGLVVIGANTAVNPGDSITVHGITGPVHLRVAGNQVANIVDGIIASPATIALFESRPAGSVVLLKTRAGADPHALARQVERSLYSQGVQAMTTREILDLNYNGIVGYATEYDVLLHMGLVVGVLALAMLGIRAAVERKRPIGILRALGYQPGRVVGGLLIEAVLTATLGVVTGVGAGLFMGYFLIGSGIDPGVPFGLDLGRVGFALAIVYATTLVVAGPVAARLARLAPTEAIRMSA